jgi:hypothetical protein
VEALSSSRGRSVIPAAAARVPRLWKLVAVILPAVFPLLVVAIALGAWLALTRTQGSLSQEWIGTWLVITLPLALWLIAVPLLARAGFYDARPTIPLGVVLLPAIGLFLLSRLPHLPQLLGATPASLLIGVQVIRLVGGVFLLVWLSREVTQPWFNVEAGSVDVLVGVTTLPVAWWVSSGWSVAIAAGVVWNLVGLVDVVLAIAISATVKGAGPMSYLVSHNTLVVAAFRPTILGIVAFGVPLAIMLHVLSLWQLLGL